MVEYPEKDWRALADRLRDRTLTEDVAEFVDNAMSVVAKSGEKRTRTRRGPRENVIERVARDDPAKAEKLSALKAQLIDKNQRLPLANIRGLASSLGMKDKLASRRDQAANQIVAYLADKKIEEIEAVLGTALPPPRSQVQEYDRWVNLILGDKNDK